VNKERVLMKDSIKKNKIKVGIIGLGYVGLPLAVEIANKGAKVIGFDINKTRVKQVNRGLSVISDVTSVDLKKLTKKKKIMATTNFKQLRLCDIILICVPTPVNENKEPDLQPVISSAEEIKRNMRKGQMVILKSTPYPETTEKVVLPMLCESGLKVGKDFYLAFCPERIDPGNRRFGVENTPTVIGGVTKKCTEMAALFYSKYVSEVHAVSSPRCAEMTKLLENTFRNVNIALVNEFAQLCERMGGIDMWEVIEAAKSKPFGYMAFYPGPGVGGHCIPIDPYYLSWKAREYDFHTVFIELSARINEEMPYFVVNKTINELSKSGVCPSKAKILLLGMSFKKDISDLRASPAIKVYQIIKPKVGVIKYHDPHIRQFRIDRKVVNSVKLTKTELKKYDALIILANHSVYDYNFIIKNSKLVIDTRNAIKKRLKKVKKLGAG
jgi:UDP-N-acetyl-D-glucosamine dehydrogenase